MDITLHPATDASIRRIIEQCPQGLLITGPMGAGKTTVAQYIASSVLGTSLEKLPNHPYFKHVTVPEGKNSIPIESVRDVIHFLMLKATGSARVVILEDAHRLTPQAQNALLKTIEEPPAGTMLILTAPGDRGILPTIRSRVQQLAIQPPDEGLLASYFAGQGYAKEQIDRALLMSNNLPGLASALLEAKDDHPLTNAAKLARSILQKSTFERLLLTDDIGKQKKLFQDTLFMLGRMAEIAILKNGSNQATTKRWQHILSTVHDAEQQLLMSVQPKLVALNFMLSL